MTGPNLRATGVPFDLRRAHPYSIYPELEFDIPTRTEGDCLARYLLRMEEIKQSLRIIDQCLHQMPDGPIMAKLPRLLRPRPGRAWAAVEGPRGQYATYAISDGTDQPFRLRIHDPSLHPPPGRRRADARQPPRRHDGDHGVAWTRSWAASTSDGVVGAGPWDRLTLPGKVDLHRSCRCCAVLTVGLVVAIVLFGPADPRHPGRQPADRPVRVRGDGASCCSTIPIAFLIIYMEMKIIALMNLRIGPDRVGPWGRCCRWSTGSRSS